MLRGLLLHGLLLTLLVSSSKSLCFGSDEDGGEDIFDAFLSLFGLGDDGMKTTTTPMADSSTTTTPPSTTAAGNATDAGNTTTTAKPSK